MTVGDPCWALGPLETFDQVGSTLDGIFAFIFGCLVWRGPWTLQERSLAEFGRQAFLRQSSMHRWRLADGYGLDICWRAFGLQRMIAVIPVTVQIDLEDGHSGETEPQLSCGSGKANSRKLTFKMLFFFGGCCCWEELGFYIGGLMTSGSSRSPNGLVSEVGGKAPSQWTDWLTAHCNPQTAAKAKESVSSL